MIRRLPVLAALLCAACTSAPPAPLAASAGASVAPAATASAGAAPTALRIAGLDFALPTAADLRAVADQPMAGPYMLGFRPSIRGAGSSAKQLQVGNYTLESYLPSPFGEAEGTASVLTARIPAPRPGDAAPYVRAWAPDGRLYTTYYQPPARFGPQPSLDPAATADEGAIVKNAGWPLTYLSDAKHEALFFYEAGVVLHVRWAPKRYTEQTVPVTLEAAQRTVAAALRDPAATSEEARSGLDHFLGVPYAGLFEAPAVNRHDELIPTTELNDTIVYNGFLGVEYAEKPVWYVQTSWGGGGLVDALTGTLIRFTRIRVGHLETGQAPSPFTPPAP